MAPAGSGGRSGGAKVTVTSTESVKVPPSVPRQHLSVPSPTEGTRDRYRYRDKRYVIDAVPRDGDAGAGKYGTIPGAGTARPDAW